MMPSRPLFSKVLIANRGEIACRIIRTCRRLGICTVAVYSEADAHSLHVRTADEAVLLGGSAPRESYLAIDKVLAAAKQTGAQAIHPGYGFLSENDGFAEACRTAGIVFIGPPANAIRAMGSKSAAKALMASAGVPLTPGYHGKEQQPEFLHTEADAIGYPVLIKASAGGGGKGMRRVDASEDFAAALASCKREAASAFGDEHVLVEKYVLQPRHIEIQVFADTRGNVVSLFERDCSVQRRHQKVLEEAPAPGMTAERRAAMGKAACDAARAVGYVGAGTVEFIAGTDGTFSFMEMNTRLQVEHPVTEMITGLDLVEWQLRVAAGEPLPMRQEELGIRGHAIEARIYAEDPANGFLPSIGKLVHLRTPASSRNVRVDAGVEQGDAITPFYDPMIAKLIVWDEDRALALQRMQTALSEFQIVGVRTNVSFLKRLIATHSFSNAELDTSLIEREHAALFEARELVPIEMHFLATLVALLSEQKQAALSYNPWSIQDGWRINSTLQRAFTFQMNETSTRIEVQYANGGYIMRHSEAEAVVSGKLTSAGDLTASIGGKHATGTVIVIGNSIHLFSRGQGFILAVVDPLATRSAEDGEESSLLSPMPGLLITLLVQPGEQVEKGTPLLVLEAMKMEYTIKAPASGVVESYAYGVGDRVSEGVQLVHFQRSAEKS